MSGGSQHNPNGRQSQLGPGWSPLQLQVASYLARAPQAHMASERGVTWHTPTPPHLYHVPAPSPPDPLQAMKVGAAGNAAFRHTATPPDLYRHTPTPPDKHLMSSRHTPSPGDVKGGPIPPPDIYQHLGPARDKLVRPEDMLSYARGGVDLTLGRSAAANGAPIALSVRDAPTINSLIARAQPPLPRPPHPRVDSLLERLAPSPVSPHSVIVHPRAPATPSPPDSNEDSADSCGAPPGSKRKRKPERVVRVPSVPPPLTPPDPIVAPPKPPERAPEPKPEPVSRLSPPKEAEPDQPDAPLENGETPHATSNGPEPTDPPEPEPHTRRKTRSGSAETIDDIAAMIASTDKADGKDEPDTPEKSIEAMEIDAPVTIDKLKSVLASPEPEPKESNIDEPKKSPPKTEEPITEPVVEAAAAPKRRRARSSKETSESTNVPVESPSEAKPAEAEASEAKSAEGEAKSGEPVPASIVDVEDQLEKMFAGIEEPGDEEHPGTQTDSATALPGTAKGKKRRKSVATKGEKKSRRSSRASTGDEGGKRKAGRKRGGGAGAGARGKKSNEVREYDSGSNASSGRSRGPYIQIRGPRDSPLSVSVINAATGEEEEPAGGGRRKGGEEFRNGLRTRGLHCSTLGLRYDATTPDASWVCAFCERGPHSPHPHRPLGDLFGPYTVTTDCEEFRALDEATRKRRAPPGGDVEVWFHEECAVWAPGLLAWGARVWGLPGAVWGAAGARCCTCARAGAGLACAWHACGARSHVPCARAAGWQLSEAQYRALCPRHGSG